MVRPKTAKQIHAKLQRLLTHPNEDGHSRRFGRVFWQLLSAVHERKESTGEEALDAEILEYGHLGYMRFHKKQQKST